MGQLSWVNDGNVRATALLALVLALPTAHPARLGAQRFTCEEASTLLLSAQTARLDRFSAGSTILECGNIAPGTIATALRRAIPNSTADTVATTIATMTFDRRLADSIRFMAVDSSQSRERRTLYLQLLTRYAFPGALVDFDAAKRGGRPVGLNWHSADYYRRQPFGTRVIRKEDRARVVATVADMGLHDPDEDLRRAAAAVAKELERMIKEADANELFPRTWP